VRGCVAVRGDAAVKPYLEDSDFQLWNGDAREVLAELPAESVHMCVTSPPFFGLRDYGCEGQIGLESTPEEWVAQLVSVFEEVKRVLRKDGTLWVECGDSYTSSGSNGDTRSGFNERYFGSGQPGKNETTNEHLPKIVRGGGKPKDLIGQPFLLAFALREAGWYWRNVCIWHKPNPMPESVRDRFTVSHSYVLLFSKSPRYFFDAEAVREASDPAQEEHNRRYARPYDNEDRINGGQPGNVNHVGIHSRPGPGGRNARSVWTIATEPLPFEHYAAFPQALAERCIKAGTSERGCCPECGAPWVRQVEETDEYLAWKQREVEQGGWAKRSGDLNLGRGNAASGTNSRTVPTKYALKRWFPSCDHMAGGETIHSEPVCSPTPIPCTVLDPFLGSGTTALVARRLGRKCIGIELNERYCELAAERTKQLSLLGEEAMA